MPLQINHTAICVHLLKETLALNEKLLKESRVESREVKARGLCGFIG